MMYNFKNVSSYGMHLFPQLLALFCAYVTTSQTTTNVDLVHVSSSLEYWPMRVEHKGSAFETTFDYPITVHVQMDDCWW